MATNNVMDGVEPVSNIEVATPPGSAPGSASRGRRRPGPPKFTPFAETVAPQPIPG